MALFLVAFNILAALSMQYLTTTGVDHEEEPNFQPVHTAAVEEEGRKLGTHSSSHAAATSNNGNAEQAIVAQKSAAPVPEAAASKTATGDLGDVPTNTHAVVPEHGAADNDSLISHTGATAGGKSSAAAAVAAAADAPSAGGCVSWDKLCYTVETPDGPRKLLDNVQGFAKPGMLVALMVCEQTAESCTIAGWREGRWARERERGKLNSALLLLLCFFCVCLLRVPPVPARRLYWTFWRARKPEAPSQATCS